MPLVCTVLLTLAALGLVFVFVLAGCAVDGFRTWKRWRRFVRLVETLDARLTAILDATRDKGEARENGMGDDVARVHEIPALPCARHDCPRRSGNCQA